MRRSPRRQKPKNPEKDKERIKKILVVKDSSSSSSSEEQNSSNSSAYSSDSEEEEQMYAFITSSEAAKKKRKPEVIEIKSSSENSLNEEPIKEEKKKRTSKKKSLPSPTLKLQVKQPITEVPPRFEFSKSPSNSPKRAQKAAEPAKNELKLILEEHNVKSKTTAKPQKDQILEFVIKKKLDEQRHKPVIKSTIPPRQDSLGTVFDIPSSESNEPFTRDNQPIEFSQADLMCMYLFNVYEEGNKLFLFGKYQSDPTQYGTICVLINNPTRCLEFLPVNGKSKELINELRALFGDFFIRAEPVMKSDFDDKEPVEWLECTIKASFELSNFPLKGHYYKTVRGVSSTLTENFLLTKKIKGCRWINVHCAQSFTKHTVIPFFICHSPDDVTIADGTELAKPSMNICIFSLFKRSYEGGQQIYMISARILYQWDYERFVEYEDLKAGHKVTTFILSQGDKNKPRNSSPTTIYCNTEKHLLCEFFNYIEHYDTDFLCSYDLIEHDIPLLLSRSADIPESILLGRFHRQSPAQNAFYACAGRIMLDIKHFYQNILSIKSASLASLVREELDMRMPSIDGTVMFNELTQPHQWNNLIGYSRKETSLMQRLIESKSLLFVSFIIARISGCLLQTIMQGDNIKVIEDQLSLAFYRTKFVIPDRHRKDYVAPLQSESFLQDAASCKEGEAPGFCALFECKDFFASIIRENNICFTTMKNNKKKGIIPALFSEYFNIIERISEKEVTDETEKSTDNCQTVALHCLVNLFEKFFISGSRRFDVSAVRDLIRQKASDFVEVVAKSLKTEDPCIIWSDGNRFITASSFDNREQAYLTFSSFFASFNSSHRKMRIELEAILKKTLIVSPYSFIALDESDKLRTEEKEPIIRCRIDWTNIECSLSEKLILAVLKANDKADSVIKAKSEIIKTLDLLKKEQIKNVSTNDFAIPFFTWQTFDASSAIPAYMHELRKKGQVDILEDKIPICMCRNGIPKLPSEIDTSSIDVVFYKNRILDVVNDTLAPFQETLSGLKSAKLAPSSNHDLSVTCSFCFAKVPFIKLGVENKCPLCGSIMQWKYVANDLVSSIRNLVLHNFSGETSCTEYMCKCGTLQIPLQGKFEHIDPCNETMNCRGRLEIQKKDMNPYNFFSGLLLLFNGQSDVQADLQEYMNNYLMRISSLYGISINRRSIQSETVPYQSSSQSDIYAFLSQ